MKVCIVNGSRAYERMYSSRGWEIVETISDADLVQFCGGEDISPLLYGEPELDSSYCNFARDRDELTVFGYCLDAGIPMTGICRGGQFLNVMCGGRMWQDVNNHTGAHDVCDLASGEIFEASSTHHQMMIAGPNARLLATAYPARSTKRLSAYATEEGTGMDTEVLFYPEQGCLCFQPHPEFAGREKLADRYFDYIKAYLKVPE